MLRASEIPAFTKSANFSVDISWRYLEEWLREVIEPENLVMDPDFQRAHVWDESKQIRYIEFCLRGGNSANNIYWNCPTWHVGTKGRLELVDGKQRIQAVRRFMNGDIPAFGHSVDNISDEVFRFHRTSLRMHVNDLQTRAEVLQWYLDINSGGVIHTEEELKVVRDLLAKEQR